MIYLFIMQSWLAKDMNRLKVNGKHDVLQNEINAHRETHNY